MLSLSVPVTTTAELAAAQRWAPLTGSRSNVRPGQRVAGTGRPSHASRLGSPRDITSGQCVWVLA